MSQILINALTIQEINSALLRVQRSIKNNQASLTTNVNRIVSSGTSTIGGKYDDTAVIAQINALSASLSQALESVGKLSKRVTDNEKNTQTNANNIASLQSLLSNFNFTYDEETNTIHFTDINGDTTDIPLIDTTYDFAFDSSTHKLSVENNLTGETVFDSVVDTTYNFSFDTTTHKLTIHNNMSGVDIFDGVVDTVYNFSWSNGTLTITDNRSANPVATINFDNRYYTEEEIQSLVLDLIPNQASVENQLADKAFVNSSIETSTATFRGTYTDVSYISNVNGDKNDYLFVKTLNSETGLYSYTKYTWVESGGDYGHWKYAYDLNTSGFTAEQLAAINSGITCTIVNNLLNGCYSGITKHCLDTAVSWKPILGACNNASSTYSSGIDYFNTNVALRLNEGWIKANLFTYNDRCGWTSRTYNEYSATDLGVSSGYSMGICEFFARIAKCNHLKCGENLTINFKWDNSRSAYVTYNGSECTISGWTVKMYSPQYDDTLWDHLYGGYYRLFADIITKERIRHFVIEKAASSQTPTPPSITEICDAVAQNALMFNGCTFSQACTEIRNGLTGCLGTVTQVKVGNTSYNPNNGIVSLPAYPTGTLTGVCFNNSSAIIEGTCAKLNVAPTLTLSNNTLIAGLGNIDSEGVSLSQYVNDHKVSYDSVSSNCFRDILQKPYDGSTGSVCPVYFSTSCPLKFNAGTGVLCVGSICNGILQTQRTFSLPSNGGRPVIKLLFEVTDWYDASANIQGRGIIGNLKSYRNGGYGTYTDSDIYMYANYGRAGTTTTNVNLLELSYINRGHGKVFPILIKDTVNSKYYLALCFTIVHGGLTYRFDGMSSPTTWNETYLCTTDSTGTLPSGWETINVGTRKTIDFFNVYCNSTCKCSVYTNGSNLSLSANAFNENAQISTVTYPGACCTGTVVFSDLDAFSKTCDNEQRFVFKCFLSNPQSSNTRKYIQIKSKGGKRVNSGKTFRLSLYSMDATLNLDGSIQYYCGSSYGGLQYSKCPYQSANCDCFWLSYYGYRNAVICSADDFEVLQTVSEAPSGITFSSFCDIVTAGVSGIQNIDLNGSSFAVSSGTATLDLNPEVYYNTTTRMFCITLGNQTSTPVDLSSLASDHKVQYNGLSSSFERPLLFGPASATDSCICSVYYSCLCPITFNACTGLLCVGRISNNGYFHKFLQCLNLSALSSDCFYPVTWSSSCSFESDIEIQSIGGSGSLPYNQNYIHFYERASGWGDMPKSLFVQTLTRFQSEENVFGCIGYGTTDSCLSVIWLRGGLSYYVNANISLCLHNSDYTHNGSIYTVGTSLCGSTNTHVGVFDRSTDFGMYNIGSLKSSTVIIGLPTKCTSTVSGSNGTIHGLGYSEYFGQTPYIDFNLNNYCGDYSSRIIQQAAGNLDIYVNNGTGCTAQTQQASFSFCSNSYMYGNVCGNICGEAYTSRNIVRCTVNNNNEYHLWMAYGNTEINNASAVVSSANTLTYNPYSGSLNINKVGNDNVDLKLLLSKGNDLVNNCNIFFALGSGGVNRGIGHSKDSSFQWLQYWDSSKENHACPVFFCNDNGFIYNKCCAVSNYTINKLDNSGRPVYFLMYNITSWYNGSTEIAPRGFVGNITGFRNTGSLYHTVNTDIAAMVSYGRNGGQLNCDSNCMKLFYRPYNADCITPVILKNDSAYYIALKITGRNALYTLNGMWTGEMYAGTVNATDSTGTLPSGWELIYAGCKCASYITGIDIYCGTDFKCKSTSLCLSPNAFNENAKISTDTYPGACCTGTVVSSDISDMATKSWVNNQGFTDCTGTVTQIEVGDDTYEPFVGVISLPAYPDVSNFITMQDVNECGYTTCTGTVRCGCLNGTSAVVDGSCIKLDLTPSLTYTSATRVLTTTLGDKTSSEITLPEGINCTGTITSVNVSVNGTSGTAVTSSGTITLTNVFGCVNTTTYPGACCTGTISSGKWNNVNGSVENGLLSFSNINFNNICDASNISMDADAVCRRVLVNNQHSLGYIQRVAVGHKNGNNSWGCGLLSVGNNDNGTTWSDYFFNTSGKIYFCNNSTNSVFCSHCFKRHVSLNSIYYTNGTQDNALPLCTFLKCFYICHNLNCGELISVSYPWANVVNDTIVWGENNSCSMLLSGATAEVLVNSANRDLFTSTTATGWQSFTVKITPVTGISCTFEMRVASSTPVAQSVLVNGTIPYRAYNACTINTQTTGSQNAEFPLLLTTLNTSYNACVYVPGLNDKRINWNAGLGYLTLGPRVTCTVSTTGKSGTIHGLGYSEYFGQTPYIDFNLNNYCGDYSSRFITESAGKFVLCVNNGTGCDTQTQQASFSFCSNGTLTAPIISGRHCGCSNMNWYGTVSCCLSYSLNANTVYYVKVGRINDNLLYGTTDIDLSVYGTNVVDSLNLKWTSGYSSDASNKNAIEINASNWGSVGVLGIGWVKVGNEWNCSNDLYLKVCSNSSGSYWFGINRRMLGGNGSAWTTGFSCTTTAPSFTCFVCTKPNGGRAFHWLNGDTFIESSQEWKSIGSFTGTRSCNCYYMRLGSFHNSNPETCIKVVLRDASHCSTVYISTKGTCLDCGNWTYQIDNEGNDFILADTLQLQSNLTDTNAYLGILDSCSTGTICMDIYQKGNDLGFNPLVSITSRYTNTLSGYSPISIAGKNLYGYTNFNNINANRVDSYVFTTTSALKCKCDITKPSRCALDIIDSLDIVEYRYKNEDKSEPKHLGIIADYTDELISGKGRDQLRIADAIGLLLQAVKELKEEKK